MPTFQNFFATRLATDIGASDTTINLETAPTSTENYLVLEARNAGNRELIRYTGVSGTQITGVTRGIGGTSAKPHSKNALVEMNIVAEHLKDLYDAFASIVLADDSITTPKYKDGSVTPAKTAFTKTVDANGWTVHDNGSWKVYSKELSFSQAINSSIDSLSTGDNSFPVGITRLDEVFCQYSYRIVAFAADVTIVFERADNATSLRFTAKSTASRTYNGKIWLQFIEI